MKGIGQIAVEYYRKGYDKHQRFGQYFVNHYVSSEHLPWPELFYEEDNHKAILAICEYLENGIVMKS
jgi:hypothetical protein